MAPDYAESFPTKQAQSAANTRSFGIVLGFGIVSTMPHAA